MYIHDTHYLLHVHMLRILIHVCMYAHTLIFVQYMDIIVIVWNQRLLP